MLVVACPRCSLDLFRLAFDAGSRFRVIGRELCRAVELFELSPGTNAIEFVLGRPVWGVNCELSVLSVVCEHPEVASSEFVCSPISDFGGACTKEMDIPLSLCSI